MATGLFTLRQQTQGLAQSAWSGPQKPPAVEVLLVGGGGSSGAYPGGGAGGLIQNLYPVASGTAITVTIGAGASANSGTNGTNSVFGNLVALGGGTPTGNTLPSDANGGGYTAGSGGGGRNGIGANSILQGGQGTFGQGNAGGLGRDNSANYLIGAGGGAGSQGQGATSGAAGSGGQGVSSIITGTVSGYAGGGGGGQAYASNPGKGGQGGGGNAGDAVNPAVPNGYPGTANTGGGGGGSSYNGLGGTPGNGGSGICVVSYPDVFAAAASTTNATVSTSGSGSIVFDGSGDYVRYPTSTNYAFGTGDFTVEAFIYRSNLDGMIVDARSGALSQTWGFYLSGANLAWIDGSGNPSTSTTVAGSTWTHVAACRSGTTFKLFINGVAGYTGTDTINYTTTSPLLVGINANLSSNPFSGYISNVRITKGTAVYTSDFTPPTAPLTKLTNTGLLLNTVSGAVFADSATGATTSGIGGQVAWNAASPFTVTGYKNRVYTWTSNGTITF